MQEQKPDLPPGVFPWEARQPQHFVFGFKQAVGNVEVALGYAVWPEAIKLFAFLKFGAVEPTIWRQHWTSYGSALDAAENLTAEAEAYLETFNMPFRPAEDLDYDDYLEHLSARINKELH